MSRECRGCGAEGAAPHDHDILIHIQPLTVHLPIYHTFLILKRYKQARIHTIRGKELGALGKMRLIIYKSKIKEISMSKNRVFFPESRTLEYKE